MIARAFLSASLPLAAALAVNAALPQPADANERDKRFFSQVQGEWTGPGEIVAGKYKGTRFTCNFTGSTPDGKAGMTLDGGCRVGFFTQKMRASVALEGRSGYRGTFLDGAAGEGLDITSGRISGERVQFTLNRNQLNGAMVARLPDADTMHVTVSVKVEDDMVPVIGMNLRRVDSRAVGAIVIDR